MSTFSGRIQEVPGIAVDNFTQVADAYFLSHCHTDHMSGLNLASFHDFINEQPDIFIYCSRASAVILKAKFPQISAKIRDLQESVHPDLIEVPNSENYVSVALIPASHCPGSVMFLFETSDKRVLYTGDFRLKSTDLRKIKNFHDSLNYVKAIDKVYLDTTFFKKTYPDFPSREESIRLVCELITDWLKSPENEVALCLSANYGYEYLLQQIHENTGFSIHSNMDAWNVYRYFPKMDSVVTTDGNARIHVSCNGYQSFCIDTNFSNVRKIRVSALSWQSDQEKGSPRISQSGEYQVCYSTHASYGEIVDFLYYLKPKEIEACVVYDKDEEEIRNNIEDIKKQISGETSEWKFF